jgi:superfamily II DNA or RNA helicase
MKATIHIEYEVNCIVQGLTPDHISHFWNAYGIFAENHFFNPKFKLGSWDGMIRYFHSTGKTYVHLLGEIIPTLASLGYDIDVNDLRSGKFVEAKMITADIFSHYIFEDSGQPLMLRDHQVEITNCLLTEGSGIAIAATGAGKTFICAAIAKQYGNEGLRTIVIVPSQDLVMQTREDFLMLSMDCGEYSGDIKEYQSNQMCVSTWQALQKNPHIVKDFDVVIVDEAHNLRGNVLTKLLNEYGHNISHRFGVTGTLPKGLTDAMAVKVAVGDVKIAVDAKRLMELGILASLDIHIEQLDENFKDRYEEYKVEWTASINPNKGKLLTYKKFKDSYFPDYTSEKTYLQKKTERLDHLSEKLSRLSESGNVFVLVDGVNFGKKLASLIPGAVFVHGKDKKKARKEIYSQFAENDNLCVLATVNIASTGLNIPRIYHLALIDIGKSFTRVIQSIGRGLRKAKDKDHVEVWDFCSDLKYGKKHLTERTKYYNEAQYPHKKHTYEYEIAEGVEV